MVVLDMSAAYGLTIPVNTEPLDSYILLEFLIKKYFWQSISFTFCFFCWISELNEEVEQKHPCSC